MFQSEIDSLHALVVLGFEFSFQRHVLIDRQQKDDRFVTDHSRKNPKGADLAESAIFAYALIHHPNRISRDAAAEITLAIPNRIAYGQITQPRRKSQGDGGFGTKAASDRG